MQRLFFALDLDETFLDEAHALTTDLRRGRLERARWVARGSMHVTLRFLGDTDESLVPALRGFVETLGDRPSVALRATSLLAFPDPRRAKIVGLSLEDEGAMSALSVETEAALTALGVSPEERPFRPHLTLARLREPVDIRALLAQRTIAIVGHVTSVTLYESALGQGPPRYTSLARATFRASTR